MSRPSAKSSLTLANRITILRILGIPVLVVVLVYYTLSLKSGYPNDTYRVIALALFATVALSDAVDGYVARSRGEITRLGIILDPIADKALLLSTLVFLTRPSLPMLEPQFPIWFTTLVISRDAVLVIGALVIDVVNGHVDIRPRILGKVTTFFQMVAVIWVLSGHSSVPLIIWICLTGLLTFVSGAVYLLDGIRQLEQSPALHKTTLSPPP
jgi:cardiolipin synthase (CMP-forming)